MTSEIMQEKTFKYNCKDCGYGTNRKWSFDYHNNRKNPCKSKDFESTNEACSPFVAPEPSNVAFWATNTGPMEGLCSPNVAPRDIYPDSETENKFNSSLQCSRCGKLFKSRQNKYRHMKNVQCKPSENVEKVNELEAKIHELTTALTQKGNVVHNTYNITNNDNSTTNNTNNIVNYNNFDSPNFDHITKEMIGEMYLKADRELPRMIGNAVRKIYKGLPENDTIRFKYGNQAGFAEVRQDDETRILPVSDVLETVLSQTSTLCSKELMKCCGPHMIPGPNVVNHAQELSVLHWGFVPETHAKRQGYFKFVKSALL